MKHSVSLRENVHSKCSAQKQFEERKESDIVQIAKMYSNIKKKKNAKQTKEYEKSITLITLTGFSKYTFYPHFRGWNFFGVELVGKCE